MHRFESQSGTCKLLEQTEILFNEQNFKHRLEYLFQEKSERFDFKNDWKQIGSFILNKT